MLVSATVHKGGVFLDDRGICKSSISSHQAKFLWRRGFFSSGLARNYLSHSFPTQLYELLINEFTK